MLIVGTEWIVDATGCRVEALRDVATLRAVVARAIAELSLLVAGEEVWHQFPEPGGVTGLVLLMESHLACHTYPEYGVATINLYCCRTRPVWPWAERLGEMLGAREVSVRVVERPAHSEVAAQRESDATARKATLPRDATTGTCDTMAGTHDATVEPRDATAMTRDATTETLDAAMLTAAATMPPAAAAMMDETLVPARARGGKC